MDRALLRGAAQDDRGSRCLDNPVVVHRASQDFRVPDKRTESVEADDVGDDAYIHGSTVHDVRYCDGRPRTPIKPANLLSSARPSVKGIVRTSSRRGGMRMNRRSRRYVEARNLRLAS